MSTEVQASNPTRIQRHSNHLQESPVSKSLSQRLSVDGAKLKISGTGWTKIAGPTAQQLHNINDYGLL